MRQYDSHILYAPSDLVRYLGCAHATALDLAKLRDPEAAPEQAEDDAIARFEHEKEMRLRVEDERRANAQAQGKL